MLVRKQIMVPATVDKKIRRLARKRGISRSALIVEAVEALPDSSGQTVFAEALKRSGHLRAGLDATRATDIMWALASEDTYQRLVVERGWTQDEFEAWLGNSLKRELLRRR